MIITDSVISRLNEDITKLGESKLQAMQESKEYRSGSLHLRLGSGDCSDSFLVFNPFPTGGGLMVLVISQNAWLFMLHFFSLPTKSLNSKSAH